jgi:hypothetical protein
MPSLRDAGKIINSLSLKDQAASCNFTRPLSVRSFITNQTCPFVRFVRLHAKILTNPVAPIDTMFRRMRTVYATAGIRVELASTETLTGTAFTTLVDIDVGECRGAVSAEQTQLFGNRNNAGTQDIVVYFVRSVQEFNASGGFVGTLNGCASHPNGQPGAVVSSTASQWTLAHEVGHVLSLNHISGEKDANDICVTPDPTRLMTGCSTNNITGTPTLSQSEINSMQSHTLTHSGGS